MTKGRPMIPRNIPHTNRMRTTIATIATTATISDVRMSFPCQFNVTTPGLSAIQENPNPVTSGNPLVAYGTEVFLGSYHRGIVHGSFNNANFQFKDSYRHGSRILSAIFYKCYSSVGQGSKMPEIKKYGLQ